MPQIINLETGEIIELEDAAAPAGGNSFSEPVETNKIIDIDTGELIDSPLDALPPEIAPVDNAATVQQPATFQERPVLEKLQGVGEAGLGLLTGAISEPIAGLDALAEVGRAFIAGEEDPLKAGADQVARTKKALTFEAGDAGKQFVEEIVSGALEVDQDKLGQVILSDALQSGIKGAQEIESAVLEKFGPEAATVLKTLPIAAMEILPLLAAGKVADKVPTEIFTKQSKTKRRIADLIAADSGDVETAKFELKNPDDFQLFKSISDGGPRVKKDPLALAAIKQGFDEGVIAAVKGGSDADKRKMLEMVSILEKTKGNKRFGLTNRPSDIAGNSLLERFRVVTDANKKAGKELDSVAKGLKGNSVNFSPAIDSFIDDLDSMGISLATNKNGRVVPDFKGSDIEDLAGPENAIKRIVKRLSGSGEIDAFELHRMKRFIDEQVTFGKSAEGLAGKTERVLKSLRRNLDQTLDSNFAEYDRVNSTFSETITAIDSLQDAAGRKIDLFGPNADKATGTLLRRLMSNIQSRVVLLDSIDLIEKVAKNQGGVFDDDLLTQVLFVDELDSMFGAVARTGFQGQIEQGVKQASKATTGKAGLADAALNLASKGAEKARGINDKAAIKSIKDLLSK